MIIQRVRADNLQTLLFLPRCQFHSSGCTIFICFFSVSVHAVGCGLHRDYPFPKPRRGGANPNRIPVSPKLGKCHTHTHTHTRIPQEQKEQKDSEMVPVCCGATQLKQLEAWKHCTHTTQKNTFVPGFKLQSRELTTLKPLCLGARVYCLTLTQVKLHLARQEFEQFRSGDKVNFSHSRSQLASGQQKAVGLTN